MSRSHIHRITGALSAVALLTGMGAAAASEQTPQPPDYTPPSLSDVSSETMRHVRVADGEGSQVAPGAQRHVQIESPAHFETAPYDVGQDVDLWLIPPEGADGQYFGTFEVESQDEPDQYWSQLGPVTFPPEAFDYGGIYAAALTDEDGELLAWQRTVLELEGDRVTEESPGGAATQTWPVPDMDTPEPSTEAPTLEDLTEDGYGSVAIQEDSPVIPLDRSFTAVFASTTQPADYWLLPPDGSAAIWLPMDALMSRTSGEVHAELVASSDDIELSGIYGLVAKNLSGSVIGWTPFGISLDAEGIQPGDPGVNADDTTTDRSTFPIPDSVPVPESSGDDAETGQSPDDEQPPEQEQTQEQTQEPQQESTSSPDETATDEATAGAEEQQSEAAETPATETVSDSEGFSGWAIALVAAAGVLVVGGVVYLIVSRRRGDA